MTLYLVRHAQSAPSDEVPHERWPLSEHGRRQALALSPLLEELGVAALYSSPYLRALETLGPFAKHAGQPIDIVADLRERSFSPRMYADFDATVRRCFDEPDWKLGEDGECNSEIAARMRTALVSIVEREHGRSVAAASHGQAISSLLTSIDPSFGHAGWHAMGNPDVFALTWDGKQLRWDGRSLRSRLALRPSRA